MLDHVEVAQRRYEEIRADSKRGQDVPFWPDLGKARQISLWLEKDVCPVVEELVENPAFRAQVSWPIRQLQAGSRTAERALVDEMDAGLVECARQLVKIARHPKVLPGLLKLEPAHDSAVRKGCGKPVPFGLGAMEFIEGRPWRDLVRVSDYYQPASNLNLIHPEKSFNAADKPVQLAEFTPFVNPGLRTLGDFVSRMLFLRIDHWESLLMRFRDCVRKVLRDSNMERDSQWETFEKMCVDLHRNYEHLKDGSLMGKAAKIRNSLIALLQVYAEYRPLAPLEWLGIPSALPRNGQAIRYQVETRKELSIAEQVAAALVDVAPLYGDELDPQVMIEAKCETHRLVLVNGVGRREVYWGNTLLTADWVANKGPWELLVALVDRAKSKQGADGTIMQDTVPGSLKDFRSRLKKLLPPDFNERIKPAGRGTYRLHLDPGEICSFRFWEDERLEEVNPQ